MERILDKEGGFSLLEVFVALLILLIGVTGLAMIHMSALTDRISIDPKAVVATGLAQDVLDRFGALPWESLPGSGGGGSARGPGRTFPESSGSVPSDGDSVAARGTLYHRAWRVDDVPEAPGLKTISVWCGWRQADGRWRQVSLITQRANVER